MLRDGSNIDQEHTAIGQDIAGLLQRGRQRLVSSVGNSRLQDLLRETFKAFNGSGPELARLIQSSRLLVDEANANYGQVTQLIDQAGPFLDAQIRGGDDIRSLADGLARFTGEVANADPQVRSVLQIAPGAADEANETFSGIRPTFPMLAANLANFGRIGVIYNKSLEQALVIFPALMAGLITVAGGVPVDEGGKLDFKIDLGDPPGCSVGFIPPPLIRSPADTTLRELPRRPVLQGSAQRSQRGARGAQLSVPGVPRQAGAHRPAVPRPPRVRADRQQPVARSAHPGGTPMDDGKTITTSRPDGTSCRPTSSRSSLRRSIRTPDRRWCSCRPGCRRVPGPRRTHRSRCRCRRTSLAPRRRRGRSSPRRIRSCRRTAERRRAAGASTRRCRRRQPAPPPRAGATATARGGAGTTGKWSGRRDLRPEREVRRPGRRDWRLRARC